MSVEHFCLQSARFKLDGGAMFGIIPKPLWEREAPADGLNRIDLALRNWLIRAPGRLVIVDTGIGDYHPAQFAENFHIQGPSHPLAAGLAALNLRPDQVTDVVITHLHFDHVGGLGEGPLGAHLPVFKNAVLHLHRQHHDYAQAPTERDAGSFLSQYYRPLIDWYQKKGSVNWLSGDEGQIMKLAEEDLRFRVSHGHTPYLMHPYTKDLIYLADLIPSRHHVHVPWVMGYDLSPGTTTKEKRQLLEWIMESKRSVIFEHDPEFWGSQIEKNAKGKFLPHNLKKALNAPGMSLS